MLRHDGRRRMTVKEETLDPENWDELRTLGHKMLDDMMDTHENSGTFPFRFPSKEDVANILTPLSEEGDGEEATYRIFKDHILPSAFTHARPKWWALVAGTGSPYGMLTEMLASGTNLGLETTLSSYYTHRQVIDWVKELLEYPEEAGGVLVSGGSEANFTSLAVARNAKARQDMKVKGVQGLTEKMTLYGSEEMHHCLERSVEILGLGNEALRWLPTDDECKIKIESLRKAVKEDREQGMHPFCVIGNAGTVNSGAFDDFKALREIADKEDMWLHIDGAFGVWVKLSNTHKHLADGIELADSLAVDLHKWMYMPYGIGCTLVRDKMTHYSTFVYGHEAAYLKSTKELSIDTLTNPHSLALPLSRNFTSLKAYMLLRAYGKNKYCRLIQQNLDQINYLAELIEKTPYLEVMAPVNSNIVCFRYIKDGLSEGKLEELNRKIMGRIRMSNFGIISDTTIKGRYMLRACCVNHRSRREDFDYLVDKLKELGEELS